MAKCVLSKQTIWVYHHLGFLRELLQVIDIADVYDVWVEAKIPIDVIIFEAWTDEFSR